MSLFCGLFEVHFYGFLKVYLPEIRKDSEVPSLGPVVGQHSSSILRSTPIAYPSLSEQQRIVAYLDDLQAKVESLKWMRAETGSELKALLPSVLDKAFEGEL